MPIIQEYGFSIMRIPENMSRLNVFDGWQLAGEISFPDFFISNHAGIV